MLHDEHDIAPEKHTIAPSSIPSLETINENFERPLIGLQAIAAYLGVSQSFVTRRLKEWRRMGIVYDVVCRSPKHRWVMAHKETLRQYTMLLTMQGKRL